MKKKPAILGGEPAFPEGPPDWPPRDAEILEALERAYRDGDWGRYHGPNSTSLCRAITATLGVEHVRLCSSGTIAVEIALRGLGVGPGDEVVLGGYDFPGNFRAIEAVGATPVLVDLEPRTRCLDVEQAALACGKHTRAVIASHLHGGQVDMPRLRALADERDIAIVEDACQAPGAIVAGRQAGGWGDVGVFSFGGSKLLTAGRGGAIVTQRANVFQRMKVFCERGNDAFPLSELQAAVLLPQWQKLPERNDRRYSAAKRLADALRSEVGLSAPPFQDDDSRPAFYKIGILYDGANVGGRSREDFIRAVQMEGIAIDAGFRGFTTRGSGRCRRVGDLATAGSAARNTLLLHHPVLLEADEAIDCVGRTLLDLAAAFRAGAIGG